MDPLTRLLIERYQCPKSFLNLTLTGELSAHAGFFRFGPGIACYGRSAAGFRMPQVNPILYDVAQDVLVQDSEVCIPFHPTEIIENLLMERYAGAKDSWIRATVKEAYYVARPTLPRLVRKQIQRFQLKGWRRLLFPNWPVDRTVENICEELLLLVLRATGVDRIPFIWFWPEGCRSCVVMTHDIETEAGRESCSDMMDIDDSFGIKASFQIVPERRYSVSSHFLATIRNRGFEIGIQDLNHDGRLFDDREEFLRRAKQINKYAARYGAKGFRAAVLYRKPAWYEAFDFSFDMSIPNTAHLDPQRGGCCTVMPYFIGNILELPVTTTQDYMLFHLLNEHSIELWRQQVELILDKSGLISFIVHPDYVMHDGVKAIYKDLLNYVHELQAARGVWVTLPREVDCWWRARTKMQLVASEKKWRIEGEGAERAVLAYARKEGGKLIYEVEPKDTVLGQSQLNKASRILR